MTTFEINYSSGAKNEIKAAKGVQENNWLNFYDDAGELVAMANLNHIATINHPEALELNSTIMRKRPEPDLA